MVRHASKSVWATGRFSVCGVAGFVAAAMVASASAAAEHRDKHKIDAAW